MQAAPQNRVATDATYAVHAGGGAPDAAQPPEKINSAVSV